MRYARKVDANHAEIVKALRRIGVGVIDTSQHGEFCDLVTIQRGVLRLVEVKDGKKPPSARVLTDAQVKLHGLVEAHGGIVHVVISVDEAIALHQA